MIWLIWWVSSNKLYLKSTSLSSRSFCSLISSSISEWSIKKLYTFILSEDLEPILACLSSKNLIDFSHSCRYISEGFSSSCLWSWSLCSANFLLTKFSLVSTSINSHYLCCKILITALSFEYAGSSFITTKLQNLLLLPLNTNCLSS